jgi:hypothetical protein
VQEIKVPHTGISAQKVLKQTQKSTQAESVFTLDRRTHVLGHANLAQLHAPC